MPTRRRPITIFDAIVLMAAAALGMAGFRAYLACMAAFYRNVFYFRFPIASRAAGAGPWLVAGMLVLPFLAARGQRRRYWRLARQPGIAACHAVGFCLASGVALSLVHLHGMFAINPSLGMELLFRSLVTSVPELAGPMIGAVWIVMAISRQWRAASDWTEMAARVLAVGWIALFLLIQCQI